MNTIYTFGYSGLAELAPFAQFLESNDLFLADIRLRAGSRFYKEWNKGFLENRLGERYKRVQELGNDNYQDQSLPVKLHDPEKGIEMVNAYLGEKSVVLLCACRDANTCHRNDAANLLQEVTGLPIVHLGINDLV